MQKNKLKAFIFLMILSLILSSFTIIGQENEPLDSVEEVVPEEPKEEVEPEKNIQTGGASLENELNVIDLTNEKIFTPLQEPSVEDKLTVLTVETEPLESETNNETTNNNIQLNIEGATQDSESKPLDFPPNTNIVITKKGL